MTKWLSSHPLSRRLTLPDMARVPQVIITYLYIKLTLTKDPYLCHPCEVKNLILLFNPFYLEYDSCRSYPFYPKYDSGRSLHLTRLPCTLTFCNPIGWLTPNDVSISGSLGNSYFSTNQCRSLGICSTKRVPPS